MSDSSENECGGDADIAYCGRFGHLKIRIRRCGESCECRDECCRARRNESPQKGNKDFDRGNCAACATTHDQGNHNREYENRHDTQRRNGTAFVSRPRQDSDDGPIWKKKFSNKGTRRSGNNGASNESSSDSSDDEHIRKCKKKGNNNDSKAKHRNRDKKVTFVNAEEEGGK